MKLCRMRAIFFCEGRDDADQTTCTVQNPRIELEPFSVLVCILASTQRRFTLEEMKQYDGKNGRSACIAYKGKIYDVTDSFLWIDGDHQGEHQAG
jgi:hypothetical protein